MMAHTIDCEQIPKIQLDILSRTLLAAMERFYSDPVNLNRYEEWLRGEEGQAYVKRNSTQTAADQDSASNSQSVCCGFL